MLQFTPSASADPAALLLVQFLAWVADQPRTYDETMSAWRTSCPRLQVWEDATAEGLVRLEAGVEATQGGTRVALTGAGCSVLAASAEGPVGR
ncbi:hypothetical protein [Muricoccus vinaceus]|uniref:Uncharacterized protein n=1 Tax=Muricoccus vinaceus TaxID=424704 RepID=A0ABV6IZR1_9PROT